MSDTDQSAPAPTPENAALEAELAAAMAGAPSDGAPLAPEAPAPVDPVANWRAFVTPTTAMIATGILPQWEISQAEQQGFSDALSECLAQLFPDGLDGKYACWFRLVAVTGGVVAVRAMQNGGKLPGIGPKRAKAPPAADHAPDL